MIDGSIAISPSDLVFSSPSSSSYSGTIWSTVPTFGTVCEFAVDRCGATLLVVISYDEIINEIVAILPRLQLGDDGRIMMGQDRLTEDYEYPTDIMCTGIETGCGGGDGCKCGADVLFTRHYRSTFVEVNSGYMYRKIKLSIFKKETDGGFYFGNKGPGCLCQVNRDHVTHSDNHGFEQLYYFCRFTLLDQDNMEGLPEDVRERLEDMKRMYDEVGLEEMTLPRLKTWVSFSI